MWFEHPHRTPTDGESGGVDLNSDESKESLSQDSHREQRSTKGSALSPEMRELIRSTLVPMLVRSYMDDMRKNAKEEATMSLTPASLPLEQ